MPPCRRSPNRPLPRHTNDTGMAAGRNPGRLVAAEGAAADGWRSDSYGEGDEEHLHLAAERRSSRKRHAKVLGDEWFCADEVRSG